MEEKNIEAVHDTPYYIKNDEPKNNAQASRPAPYYIKDDEPKENTSAAQSGFNIMEGYSQTQGNDNSAQISAASNSADVESSLEITSKKPTYNPIGPVPSEESSPYYIELDPVKQQAFCKRLDEARAKENEPTGVASGQSSYHPSNLPIENEASSAPSRQLPPAHKQEQATVAATLAAIDDVVEQSQEQDAKKSNGEFNMEASAMIPVVRRETSPSAVVAKPVPGYDTVEDYLFQPRVGLLYLKTGERIANFTIWFSNVIRCMKENGIWTDYYGVQAENRSGHRISLRISLRDMAKLADKVRRTDGRFHLAFDNRNAEMRFKTFVSLLAECNAGTLPIRHEFDFLGWGTRPDGCLFYCSHALNACVYSKNRRIVPFAPEANRPSILKAWFDFLSVGNYPVAILPLWIYNSFYGFALRALREAGFHGHTILMLRGRSGSLKSAVAEAMAMSDARGGISFESSLASMEERLVELRDNVVNLDDLNDPNDKEKTRKLEHLLRVLSNDIPKNKFDVVARKPRALNFRVGCTITAEQPLSQSTSSRLRYIAIDVDRASFNGDVLKPYQDDMARAKMCDGCTHLEGAYGLIIGWLEQNYDSLVEELKHLDIVVDSRLREPRYISNYRDFMALAYLADHFLQGCVEHGYLLPEVLYCFRNYNMASMMTEILLANQSDAVQAEGWKLALSEIILGMTDGSMPIADNAAHFDNGNGRFFGFHAPKGQLALMADKVIQFAVERVRAHSNGNRNLTPKEIEGGLDKAKVIGRDEPEGEKVRHRCRQRYTVNKVAKRLWWTWNTAVAEAVWEDMNQESGGFIS